MARSEITPELKAKIRETFSMTGSKKATAAALGIGETTVGKYLAEPEASPSGQVVEVALDDILIPAERAEVREEEDVPILADSIRELGLLQAIVLRRDASSGKPMLVVGRTRMEAFRSLGRTHIPATFLDLDDLHAELAELTENLHRSPLKGHDLDKALARWKSLYEAIHPPRPKSAAGDGLSTRGPEADAPRFDEVAAPILGLSERTVREAVQRGRAFDDDDRQVFEEKGVKPSKAQPIAAIPEKAKRKAVVKEIAAGKAPEEALEAVVGPPKGKAPKEAPAEAPEAVETIVGPPPELIDDDLTDAEWLGTLPLLGKVGDPGLFKAEALLYRATVEIRQAYARKMKSLLKPDALSSRGRVAYALGRPLAVKHPRQWLLCTDCGGSGSGCSTCRGGYLVS